MCMYSIIHGPLLGICAIYVDLPLCKGVFSFVYKPGRNTIPCFISKDKDQGPGNVIKQRKVINSKSF